jgi:putative ABC transport system ATP-binding protein
MIKTNKITKTFLSGGTTTTVLHGVSLEVPKGQFLAIMGRSGAGKSTLMYQLSLLDRPTTGVILIGGIDATAFSIDQATKYRLQNFGYIFQDYALLPELTSIENVALPLLMLGVPLKIARMRATNMLVKVKMDHRLHNLPSQLSGGEQQRVSVARAIINEPSVIFADEPTANLDVDNSIRVMDLLSELHAEGQTIVMVTHEEEYSKRAQRIVRLSDGAIISDEKVQK